MPIPNPTHQTSMRRRSLWLKIAACGVVLAVLAGPAAFAAPQNDEIREAARTVLSDRRFQTELPGDAQPTGPASESRDDWRLDLPEGLFGVARLLMWVLVAVGGVLAAIFVINEITSFRLRSRGSARDDFAQPADAGAAAGQTGPGTSLDAADRLAGDGRFAEALHMLLLDCIAQLRRLRFESLIVPSLTSREVVGRLDLPESSTKALTAIVSAVEVSHFGGREPDESDYRSCRESYLQIARDSVGAT